MKVIKAKNRHGVTKYTWRADSLRWKELPKWLLHAIEQELPEYKIEVYETY